MQSPTLAGPPDAGQASEAATPGASVAVHGDHTASLFDTPGEAPPSPGQASPAPYRSQEGRSSSRGRQAPAATGLEAAVAMLAASDTAALGSGPLSAPRLRVQGPDIILEDASSPKAPGPRAAQGAEPSSNSKQLTAGGPGGTGSAAAVPRAGAAAAAGPAQAAAAAANHVVQPAAAQQQLSTPPLPPGQQQQHHHLVAAARASQSHEHELQLRLASRTATNATNMALAGSRPTHQLNSGGGGQGHGGDDRQRDHGGGGTPGELPSSSGAGGAAVEGPVRMKYRSTLTEENVAYLNKLEQYTSSASSRPDAAGRSSSERIWRWLEGSGPPFDNPPPSLGVPSVTKGANLAATSRRQEKRSGGGFFSCFNCFGGGSGGGTASAR